MPPQPATMSTARRAERQAHDHPLGIERPRQSSKMTGIAATATHGPRPDRYQDTH
jgi:hypothetical protein